LTQRLQELLERALTDVGAPGACVAVRTGDELKTAAAGIANANTGVEVTPGTLFMSGSTQKVFTAVVLLSLGVDLETKARDVLPDVRDGVTLRHLLAHTSGIDGDLYFVDTGRGDDALARYVEACAPLPQLFAPGEHVSYCNAGYAIAGRMAEVVAGKTYEALVAEHVLQPHELQDTVLFPEEALLRSAAIGHFPSRSGVRAVEQWGTLRGMGPAGSTMALTAGDLALFGLRAASRTEMAEPQVPRDPRTVARGLGWELVDHGGTTVLSHDGFNGGQCASLRAVPSRNASVAVMVNHARGPMVARPVLDYVLSELFGVPAATMPAEVSDGTTHDGVYERRGVRFEVDGLLVTQTDQGRKPNELKLRPAEGGVFLMELPVFGDVVASFVDDQYFVAQGRVAKRVTTRVEERAE
jgi:CubicO group peptidase (beta-lactamase class C family)